MSKRRCKFDSEWEQALSLLGGEEAKKAREIIENYQQTGEIPEGIEPKFEMILLLVKPLIDRRRRATESARRRRLLRMEHPAIAFNQRKKTELHRDSSGDSGYKDYNKQYTPNTPEEVVPFKRFNPLLCRPVLDY